MIKKLSSLVIFFVLTSTVFAREVLPTPSPSVTPGAEVIENTDENIPVNPWRLFLGIEGTGGNKTGFDIQSYGASIWKSKDNGKSSGDLLVGLEKDLTSLPLSLGGELTFGRYKYNDGQAPDAQITAQVVAKSYHDLSKLRLWIGIGFGYMAISPGLDSITTPTQKAEMLHGIPLVLLSPRIGADFMFSGRFGLGAHLIYTYGSGTVRTKITDLGTGANREGDFDYTRRWATVGVRAIYQF